MTSFGQRRPRLGLRSRVALSWALVAGIMISSVGGLTYAYVRRYLIVQRDETTSRQAYSNARVVRDTLRVGETNYVGLLESLRTDAGSFPLLKRDSKWYGTTSGRGAEVLPASLVNALDAGVNGRMRFHESEVPYLAVGLVIPAIGSQYVEVFPQNNLDSILNRLRSALITSALTGLLLAGVFGWWSAGRVLSPVRRVAKAAAALAGGALDTRLSPERDVELNRLVGSFNAMTDAVQQRIERETRFASDVSHELRTPLGALSAATEVLERRKSEMPERAGQAVDVINSQVRRLSTMVLDLLEIARIDAGVADVHFQDTEIGGLVRHIVRDSASSTAAVEAPRVVRAPIDRRRFEQILRNLLDNGEKYGHGVERVTVVRNGVTVSVHVDDRGSGVPADQRAHVFERFVRGTSTQDVPGTGLGLALARDQAHLMGATVEVADAPTGSGRFTIALRAERSEHPSEFGTNR